MSSALNFELATPASVGEAVKARAANPEARYIAGGTDLMPNLRRGIETPPLLIGLEGIDELKTVTETDGYVTIGAGVTLADLQDMALVHRFPALAAAGDVAGPGLREAATLGGNLCLDTRCLFYNQSLWWRKANNFCLKRDGDTCHVAPQGNRCHAAFSGDMAPALMVLGSEIKIANADGERWQPLDALYRDDGRDHLTLAPEDLVVAVRIPQAAGALRSGYRKARIRRSIDFPLAGVAVALNRDGDTLSALSIALTGTNSHPFLVDGLENAIGRPLDEDSLKAVTKRIGQMIKPMRTTNIPGNYRRHVSGQLARGLITGLYETKK